MAGYVNRRAEEMWWQIAATVDFNGKIVVDVGCGPGDFIRLALKSGAEHVLGIDKDYMIASEASLSLINNGWRPGQFNIAIDDIDYLVDNYDSFALADICMCFSCLPYVRHIGDTLKWIHAGTTEVALIECQYDGDGPEAPNYIKNDDDMHHALSVYWPIVEKIGETKLDIRPATRSIWACYNE